MTRKNPEDSLQYGHAAELFLPPNGKEDSHKATVRHCPIGTGVFAVGDIAKGEYVAGFYGAVFVAAKATMLPDCVVNHAIQFSEHLWRDSAGIARYFNHSCEPKALRQNKLTIFMKCVLVRACKKLPHCSQSNRGIAH